jgi:hypothetical protein
MYLSEQVVRAVLSVAGFLATIGVIRRKTRKSNESPPVKDECARP